MGPWYRRSDSADDTSGPIYVRVSIAFLILSISVTTIRFFLEWRRRKISEIQDILISCTVASVIVQTVVGNLAIKNGFGHHMNAIERTGGDRNKALFFYWLFQLIYKISLCSAKLSVLALYMRIFTVKSRMRYIIWASICFVSAGGIAFTFTTLFQCTPVIKAWNRKTPGHCVDNTSFRWSWAAFDISTDAWIWLLPMPSFFRLKQSMPQRLGLVGIFLLGLFTCLASIFRMVGIRKSTTSSDISWSAIPAFIWSDVEAKTALIAVSLPAYKSVLCGWIGEREATAISRSTGKSRRDTTNEYPLSVAHVCSDKTEERTPAGIRTRGNQVREDHESETGILAESHNGIKVMHQWSVDSEEDDNMERGFGKI